MKYGSAPPGLMVIPNNRKTMTKKNANYFWRTSITGHRKNECRHNVSINSKDWITKNNIRNLETKMVLTTKLGRNKQLMTWSSFIFVLRLFLVVWQYISNRFAMYEQKDICGFHVFNPPMNNKIIFKLCNNASLRYLYPRPPLNLKPPLYTACIHLLLPIVCMWYIVVASGSVVVLGMP